MTNTPIPKGVFPVFVTATSDYFTTNKDAFVGQKFERFGSDPAVLIRGHMPGELHKYIVPIVTLAARRVPATQEWGQTVQGPNIEILSVQNIL